MHPRLRMPARVALAIDVPNGGAAARGASQNYKIIDYGEEGLVYSNNNLLISGNSFASSGTPSAVAIYDPNCVSAQLSNNTFSGITEIVNPTNCAAYGD